MEYEIKFKYYQSEKGRYSFKVTLLPDCYYDLEIEKEIKYEIGAAKNNFSEPLIDSPTKETDSIFGSLMKQISLEEPEEESDK